MTKLEAIEKLLHAKQLIKEVAEIVPKTNSLYNDLGLELAGLDFIVDHIRECNINSIEEL